MNIPKTAALLCFFAHIFPATAQQAAASLEISTFPDKVSIYINNEDRGYTPFKQNGLIPGYYEISLSKDGYYTQELQVFLENGSEEDFFIDMQQITGKLHVSVFPEAAGAPLYIDGKPYTPDTVELPEGTHTVEVRRFGFKPYTQTVSVSSSKTAELAVYLEPAAFDVALYTTGSRFNPQNPGSFGVCDIAFSVTAPGTAVVSVFNEHGIQVAEKTFDCLTGGRQVFKWDGKAPDGTVCKDGVYTVQLQAAGNGDSQNRIIRTQPVHIDSSVIYSACTAGAAGAGTGAIPSAAVFPRHTVFLQCAAAPFFTGDCKTGETVPVSFSLIASPFDWLECAARGALWITGPSSGAQDTYGGTAISGSFSAKAGKSAGKNNRINLAAAVQYGAASEERRMAEYETGFNIYGLAGIRGNRLSATAEAGCRFGDNRGQLTSGNPLIHTGLALSLRKKSVSGGIWGQLYIPATQPADFSMLSGIDTHFFLPSSNIALTVSGKALWTPGYTGISLSAGFGILF